MLITPERSQTKPDIAPKIKGIESSKPPCKSPVKGMNFPDAIQVRNDIKIPKLATATGTEIDRPFLSATTAIALANNEIIEKILSFGVSVKVLAPSSLAQKIKGIAEVVVRGYE